MANTLIHYSMQRLYHVFKRYFVNKRVNLLIDNTQDFSILVYHRIIATTLFLLLRDRDFSYLHKRISKPSYAHVTVNFFLGRIDLCVLRSYYNIISIFRIGVLWKESIRLQLYMRSISYYPVKKELTFVSTIFYQFGQDFSSQSHRKHQQLCQPCIFTGRVTFLILVCYTKINFDFYWLGQIHCGVSETE